MIVFNLKCRKDHGFEAWFRDNASFDAQVAAGDVRCPVCGSKKVEKALMAPHVAKGARAEAGAEVGAEVGRETNVEPAAVRARKALLELRRRVEANCDYVGPSFAEEARKIHYGETDRRNIYGETSDQEAKMLQDEGVEVSRVPWLPRENS